MLFSLHSSNNKVVTQASLESNEAERAGLEEQLAAAQVQLVIYSTSLVWW